jgi:metal-responsive CopG/Arc/MetJ family transcriptional regulator
MHSQITVRLSEELTEQVDQFAKRLRRKRSDIVRLALEKFVSETEVLEEPRPYDRVKELIGAVSSGIPNLGEAHREYLVNKFKNHA